MKFKNDYNKEKNKIHITLLHKFFLYAPAEFWKILIDEPLIL